MKLFFSLIAFIGFSFAVSAQDVYVFSSSASFPEEISKTKSKTSFIAGDPVFLHFSIQSMGKVNLEKNQHLMLEFYFTHDNDYLSGYGLLVKQEDNGKLEGTALILPDAGKTYMQTNSPFNNQFQGEMMTYINSEEEDGGNLKFNFVGYKAVLLDIPIGKNAGVDLSANIQQTLTVKQYSAANDNGLVLKKPITLSIPMQTLPMKEIFEIINKNSAKLLRKLQMEYGKTVTAPKIFTANDFAGMDKEITREEALNLAQLFLKEQGYELQTLGKTDDIVHNIRSKEGEKTGKNIVLCFTAKGKDHCIYGEISLAAAWDNGSKAFYPWKTDNWSYFFCACA
jgi:hypothetical protein